MAGVLGVHSAGPQDINLIATQREKSSSPTVDSRRNADVYVSDTGNYTLKPAVSKLTAEMATSLAKKYDVKNMNRNEYGNLLKELRDLGVISSEDFSVGYGGAVPYGGPSGLCIGVSDDPNMVSWPSGQERADFTELLRSCAQYCKNFSYSEDNDGKGAEICKSLGNSYDRLFEIFEQIGRASK